MTRLYRRRQGRIGRVGRRGLHVGQFTGKGGEFRRLGRGLNSYARRRMASRVAWSSLRASVFLSVVMSRFYGSDFTFGKFSNCEQLHLFLHS
jgi:hypothetical protein